MLVKTTMASFTTPSSGTEYGLVKDHGKCDLEKAKSRIAKPHIRDDSFAVHVFRSVIESSDEVPQWTEKHIASSLDDVLKLSLQSVDDYRLCEKCKVNVGKSANNAQKKKSNRQNKIEEILQRLNDNVGNINLSEVDRDVKDKRHSTASRIERFFQHATRADSNYLYVYNCESMPQGVISCLNGISGHLDPTKNSRVEEMAGINTSMFYIGSAGSFTEMHVEDSIADSVNIIHMGKEKIWMIIDREDYLRTNDIINKKLKEIVNNQKDKKTPEVCALPLQHKNLIVTPRFLDDNNIRYEFVVQKAGDLLYVRYGILHQVVNVGVNVAEAINVGSDGWNFSNELKMLCPCKACEVEHVATNTDVDMTVKVGKVETPMQRCDTCAKIFGTKKLLEKHQKVDHRVFTKPVCTICDKQFEHAQSLNRHVRTVHSTGQKNEIRSGLCDVCNKMSYDIVRHKRDRHLKLVECPECKSNFTRDAIVQHQKACMKFTCVDCSKEFKSRNSLANHRGRWCKNQKEPRPKKKQRIDKQNATDD